jgi:hypothetical protein
MAARLARLPIQPKSAGRARGRSRIFRDAKNACQSNEWAQRWRNHAGTGDRAATRAGKCQFPADARIAHSNTSDPAERALRQSFCAVFARLAAREYGTPQQIKAMARRASGPGRRIRPRAGLRRRQFPALFSRHSGRRHDARRHGCAARERRLPALAASTEAVPWTPAPMCPEVLAQDLERGFLLLSDLGNATYLQAHGIGGQRRLNCMRMPFPR